MFDASSVIEVVIGLVLAFSLMAILVTQVNGIITTVLNLRAKQLKDGIQRLITDPYIQAKVLAHPIINMVKTQSVPANANLSAQDADAINKTDATDVTYIAPATFIEALMGILIAQSDTTLHQTLRRAIHDLPPCPEKSELRELLRELRTNYSEAAVRRMYELANEIEDQECQQALLAGLAESETQIEGLIFKGSQLVPLLDGIDKVNNDRFKTALQSILISAETIEEARVQLENWFNNGMDRVSEIFRRRMQMISIAVAFALTIIFNVDALYLARTLWEDPQLRQSVVAAANEFQRTGTLEQPDSETLNVEPGVSPLVPEGELDDIAAQAANGDPIEVLREQARATGETVNTLLELQLPIGWQNVEVTDEVIATSLELGLNNPVNNPRNIWNFVPGNNEQWWSLWLQKIAGIIATTIAASQGAPFWFDLLNRLASRGNT